ncbi:MAG TPA: MFS transporter [Ignavibacteriales bacterium]|nr:MFS transporter [Ignavibacteriales bacterium]
MNSGQTKERGILKSSLQEITQPFIDLIRAPRALWGINLAYLLEGFTYFGLLTLLTIYFPELIGLNDVDSGRMVGLLTGGITLSMLFLGATVDIVGIRKALLYALGFLFLGRVALALAPGFGGAQGIGSVPFLISCLGILIIVIGFGIFQPAIYAGTKKFTDEKSSAMAFAALYGVNNLGAFLSGLVSPSVRSGYGINGMVWVYAAFTIVTMIAVYFILSKKTVQKSLSEVNLAKSSDEEDEMSGKDKLRYYIKNFPLKDTRFLFFILILIPVQTLFAHAWLTLPVYFKRAFTGVVSDNFEFFVNLSPLLIFILSPIAAAFTAKRHTYNIVIAGTFVMALPAFFLALGPNIFNVFAYLILMTIGEAVWQPRFLQWVAEIAPKGMTGIYMGIGQFPWFLTKVITSLYSGWFLMTYAPDGVPPEQMNTETMWLIYGFIAAVSPISLLIAKKWMMKGFAEKSKV